MTLRLQPLEVACTVLSGSKHYFDSPGLCPCAETSRVLLEQTGVYRVHEAAGPVGSYWQLQIFKGRAGALSRLLQRADSGFLWRPSGASTTGRAAAPAATLQQHQASRAMVSLMLTQLQLALLCSCPLCCEAAHSMSSSQAAVVSFSNAFRDSIEAHKLAVLSSTTSFWTIFSDQ